MNEASRYMFGGDEHLVVMVSESMSLDSFFHSVAVCNVLESMNLEGITEICPANASFLIRFDPDITPPQKLEQIVRDIEAQVAKVPNKTLDTRIIEIPLYYNDPWTNETLLRFRDRHQDPDSTDLEYAARINDYPSIEALIEAHHSAPWFVSMVGFVAGLPFLYQMVERDKQIEVPKYIRPRTDTPRLTLGHGGCFGAFYSVRGAGGYQMFGISPVPIFDPEQKLPHFKDFMCFFKPGDIVKWRPIDRAEYDQITADVANNDYELNIKPISFSLDEYNKDAEGVKNKLIGALHA